MQPVEEILERWGPLLPLLHDAEVCPKTLCQADRDSNLVDNDVDAFRAALIERAGLGAGDPLAAVAELLGRVDVDSAGASKTSKTATAPWSLPSNVIQLPWSRAFAPTTAPCHRRLFTPPTMRGSFVRFIPMND